MLLAYSRARKSKKLQPMKNQIIHLLEVLAISIFCFATVSATEASASDLIQTLEIHKNQLKVQVNEAFKTRFLRDDFFAEYDDDIDLQLLDNSIVVLPFILNVMPAIWISGREWTIDSIDEDIYYSLEKVKKIYERMYPKTSWLGKLTPRKVVKNQPIGPLKNPDENRALLYSGGVDSLCASVLMGQKQLLITAWGQFDIPLEKPDLWEIRKKSFSDFGQKYGNHNAFVKSNYACFLNWGLLHTISEEIKDWRIDTTEGMGMLGLAVPIMLLKGYQLLHIASTYTWSYPYPSSANPLVDANLLIAGAYRLEHDQFDLSRFQKTECIVNKVKEGKIECPKLKVCDGQRANNCCDDCSKCIQTIVALLVLGADINAYGFDMPREAAIERAKRYIAEGASYWVSWNIKQAIQYVKSKNEPVPDDLCWLLTVDLKEHVTTHYVCNKTPVNWAEFQDLASTDMVIPNYATELL